MNPSTFVRPSRALPLWLTILLLALFLALPTVSSAQSCSYTVRPDDTLSRIAGQQGTTVSALLRANPQISNPNVIRVGQRLQLPGCAAAQPATPQPPAPQSAAPQAPAFVPPPLQSVPVLPAELAPALWKQVHDATITIRHPVEQPMFSGSGIVVGKDGRTFLTAYHVIGNAMTGEEASRVTIGPFGGWRYTADVIATDPTLDLALLRVNEADFPGFAVAPLGTSRGLGPGSPIYTLSYPGITGELRSGRGHWLTEVRTFHNRADLIVTDAPADFGSSGGVAVNARGEVIGIITAGILGAEGIEAIGFRALERATMLVPIDAAAALLREAGVR